MNSPKVSFLMACLFLALGPGSALAAETPKAGDKAPDFTLTSLDGRSVRLGAVTVKESVVLIVLRGWPGYQCPVCDLQVHDFIAAADRFAAAKARVIFVYPGPAEGLKGHAEEFLSWKGREWPTDFIYLLDPGYSMVNAYGLRWNAPQETAYPSTFVIDTHGVVRFAKTSRSHGDRSKPAEVLAQLGQLAK